MTNIYLFFFSPPNLWSYPSSLWLTDFVVFIILQKILISLSLQFGNLLSPESKPYCQSEPHSPYLNIKSHSFGLTPLKGSQTVTQSLPSVSSKFSIFNKPPCTLMASSVATNPAHLPTISNKFSIFNKPPCTLMASSVATNPETAHDGAFPIPSPKFKPPQRKLKYSGTSKPKKKVTVSYK